jgi:DNA-binding IclR family transcriptional regulator
MTRIKRAPRIGTAHPSLTAKDHDVSPAKAQNTLQTLDRGLQALTLLSQQAAGMSIAGLAEQLGVHRAIAYRLVTTLEGHGLITRNAKGTIHLGAGLLVLASRFEPQFRTVAQPLLHELANDTRAAAFISVPQGNECVAIMVAEPEGGLLRVTYRVGSRHPLVLGAAGVAILAGRPEQSNDSDIVRQARADGFSVTRGQLQRGAIGIACPLHNPGQPTPGFEASLGVVTVGEADIPQLTDAVMTYARRLQALLKATG